MLKPKFNRPCGTREVIYLKLRRQILEPGGAALVLSNTSVGQDHACSEIVARDCLVALAADGYLRYVRPNYFGALWDEALIGSWAATCSDFFDIAMGALVSPSHAECLAGITNTVGKFQTFDYGEEASFLALLDMLGALLRLSGEEPIADLAAEVVPVAFFRLTWVADHAGIMPLMMTTIIENLRAGDLVAARETNRQGWEDITASITTFVRERASGEVSNQRVAQCKTREKTLAGNLRPFGRALTGNLLETSLT